MFHYMAWPSEREWALRQLGGRDGAEEMELAKPASLRNGLGASTDTPIGSSTGYSSLSVLSACVPGSARTNFTAAARSGEGGERVRGRR